VVGRQVNNGVCFVPRGRESISNRNIREFETDFEEPDSKGLKTTWAKSSEIKA